MKRLYIIIVILFISVLSVNSQTCSYGEINDPYPGKCGRYYDSQGDGICDLSQEITDTEAKDSVVGIEQHTVIVDDVEEDSSASESEIDYTDPIDTETVDEISSGGELNYNEEPLENGKNKHSRGQNKNSEYSNEDPFKNKSYTAPNQSGIKRKSVDRYHLNLILPVWIMMIALTAAVKNQKFKKVKLCDLNTIWNWILLVSFAFVFFTTIVLLLREYGIIGNKVSTLIYLHNISGIIFILSSISNIYLKYQYYILIIQCRIRGGR